MFALDNPAAGGIHVLAFVSALRLDGAHGGVVMDAAVLPLTRRLVGEGVLEGFLLVLRELECCSIEVEEGELAVWKSVLPGMVERCRTWEHKEGCEYVQAGRVPVSLEHGEPVLCGCGVGVGLDEGFVSIPEWETAAKYATRAAISLVFASPLVEEGISPEKAKVMAEELTGKAPPRKRCHNCGSVHEVDGVKLKKCARCSAVEYCSVACQREDWKKHRLECRQSVVGAAGKSRA